MRFVYPSTPMVDDVFVIQQKYGADMTTRTGNTTYGFNATADVTNDAMRFDAGEMATISPSGMPAATTRSTCRATTRHSVIDLREGAYSSAGGFGAYNAAQAALDVDRLPSDYLALRQRGECRQGLGSRRPLTTFTSAAVAGANEGIPLDEITGSTGNYLMENNIGIAYGAIIENAIGGDGNDRINGNYVEQRLHRRCRERHVHHCRPQHGAARRSRGGTRTVIDTSVDGIMDFGNGDDTLDLTEFGHLTIGDVSWNDATDTLLINTDARRGLRSDRAHPRHLHDRRHSLRLSRSRAERKALRACPGAPFLLAVARLADGVGFEPTVGLHPRRFSRPLP